MNFKLLKSSLLCVVFWGFMQIGYSQTDSLQDFQKKDTVSLVKNHSPKVACIASAVLPGAGQMYNRSYWKVPVIYAGFWGLGRMYSQNQDYYKAFQSVYNDYRSASESGEEIPSVYVVLGDQYSSYQLKEFRDAYRRKRDMAIIGMGLLYALNIIEAYVDAHMYTFDVSDDLTLHYAPSFYIANSYSTGVKLSLQF